MKTFFERMRRRVTDEAGAALVVVLALSITMLILITAALSFSLSGMKVAHTDVDTTAALAAAYAGVDEYSSRLSNDSRYQRYGNPAAPFTVATGSDSSVSLPPEGEENPAFGIGEGGSWASIAGTDDRASFRYEVDNSRYSSTGTLRVRSTGRVGDETASVVADLKQSGFIDFLYYTTYEIMDPVIADTRCMESGWSAYKSGGNVRHGDYCTEIQFADNDVLDGKVHSNDIMRICSSTFKKRVTTSTQIDSPQYVDACSTDATFLDPSNAGHKIPRVAPMEIPPTNGEMQIEARVDLPEIARPGCMFTGPTSITFLADGRINVVSPWTKVTQPSLTTGIPSKTPAECGDIDALHTSAGATFTPPAQNLIYVQAVPGDSDDPNYSLPSSWVAGEWVWVPGTGWDWVPGHSVGGAPDGFECNDSGKSSEGWTFRYPTSGSSPTVRFPAKYEETPRESKTNTPAYGCTNGDAYVEGTVSGQITVATSNYIYVTDDLTYADSAVDVLGLVGNNAVWVWNPMSDDDEGYGCRNGYCPMKSKNRTINAAILSVQHTFQVQNYAVGPHRGTLTVIGALAQKFRGTVGTSAPSGYDKDYRYDNRLFSISPPKFLLPTSTTYGVTKYALVKTAFLADGTVIP